MKTEKRRAFIINFLYFTLIMAVSFIIIKYGLPMLSPFVIAFLIAYVLRRPIGYISGRLGISRKLSAILTVLLFYCTIGLLISLLSVKAISSFSTLIGNLPGIYAYHVEPALKGLFDTLEQSALRVDASLLDAFDEMEGQFVQSLGQMVSRLSMEAMSWISGLASSLPGLFIKLLLMIISTFFIAADYDLLTGFCLRQLDGKTENIVLQIKEYVVGTLFVCIRSYALIMSITFVELALGLTVIGVEKSLLIAFIISVFDILPVLGTGGIMIPWTVLTALQGDYPLAIGLLVVYLAITVIRNIIEPKIVGSQIGLHPVVTLSSMFAGAQLFGILGLFGFPIGLSLLRHLNDNGTLRIFKMEYERMPLKPSPDKVPPL